MDFLSAFFERITYSLIYHERPERIAHGRSFVLSNLSESLTVTHLIWAKLANEQMSDAQMSEFPALHISMLYALFCKYDLLDVTICITRSWEFVHRFFDRIDSFCDRKIDSIVKKNESCLQNINGIDSPTVDLFKRF